MATSRSHRSDYRKAGLVWTVKGVLHTEGTGNPNLDDSNTIRVEGDGGRGNWNGMTF